jgi:hypothetical protein
MTKKNGLNIDSKNIVPEDLTPNDTSFFKLAPITSVDVERSFSVYKTLLADNGRSYFTKKKKKKPW